MPPLSMKLKPISLAIVAMSLFSQTSQAALLHPGMSHTQADLDRMKYQVEAQIDPWYSSYQEMSEDSKASYDYEVQGDTSMTEIYRDSPYTNLDEFESDSRAAYYNAIRWIVEGDSSYADKAVEIFNAWTGLTYVQHSGTMTLSGSMIYVMLEAAEIIKSTYDGWSDEDIEKFGDMLVYPGYSNTEVPDDLETQGTWYWRVYMGDPNRAGNQELSGWRAAMAIGIFLDNEIIYDRAYRYVAGMTHRDDDLAYHSGPNYSTDEITTTPYNIAYNYESSEEVEDSGFDGVLTNYVWENGQCAEASRDQGHTMWGLSLIGALSEMAWSQGDDLYGLEDNRYLLGLEYALRYNLSYLQSYDDQEDSWEPTVDSGEFIQRANKTARTKSLAINPYYEYDYDGDNVSRGNLSQSFYELVWGHYVGRGIASEDDDAKWLTRGRDYHLEDNDGIEQTDTGGAYIGWGGLTYYRIDEGYGDPVSGFDSDDLPEFALHILPTTIEAENYDYFTTNGNGKTYYDTSDGNSGSEYRTDEDVDIEVCDEGGYNLGYLADGEWLTYTVYVPETGNYDISLRYAARYSGGSISLYFDGDEKASEVTAPSTGGWQQWDDLEIENITLEKGVQVLKILYNGTNNSLNLNHFTISQDFTFVQLLKASATDYAVDGNDGGDDGQDVYLWYTEADNENQHWIEIDQGDGYYSYQKRNTDFCLDGNNGATDDQNVYLWTCSDSETNQHWEKVEQDDGSFMLQKRGYDYVIDTGDGASIRQSLYLAQTDETSNDQQWIFNYISISDDDESSDCELVTPYDLSTDTITSSSATVSWSDDSTDISHYNVRYSELDADSWTKIKVDASESSTSFSDLTAETDYEWQVRAICEDDTGTTYSDAEEYFTTNSSDACSLVTPYNLAESDITSSSVTLTWDDSSENVSHYNVRYSVSGESDWTKIKVDASNTSTSVTSLSSSTDYDWQVRAICEDDTGTDYNDAESSFTTD